MLLRVTSIVFLIPTFYSKRAVMSQSLFLIYYLIFNFNQPTSLIFNGANEPLCFFFSLYQQQGERIALVFYFQAK